MKTILFVCSGNTCRSPMAEALMNKLLKDAGIESITAESAGISVQPGEPVSKNAQAALLELGTDISDHRARQITQEIIANSEAIYTMTPSHAIMLKAVFPEADYKINVLGRNIPDPFGEDFESYIKCRNNILNALNTIIEQMKMASE